MTKETRKLRFGLWSFSGAWRLTLLLAQDHGAEVVVAHVIPPPSPAYSETDVVFEPPPVTTMEDLELLRKNFVSDNGVPIRYLVDHGDAGDVIVRLAENNEPALRIARRRDFIIPQDKVDATKGRSSL